MKEILDVVKTSLSTSTVSNEFIDGINKMLSKEGLEVVKYKKEDDWYFELRRIKGDKG